LGSARLRLAARGACGRPLLWLRTPSACCARR